MKDPTLQEQRGSPFWYADFEVWHADLRRWKRTFKSTKKRATEENREEAMRMAREFARVARQAYEGANRGWDGVSAAEMVNGVLSAAGLPTAFVQRPSWNEYLTKWWTPRQATMDPATRAAVELRLRIFTGWLGQRARVPMDLLTNTDLQTFWSWLCETYTGSTPNNVLSIVRRIFKRAHAEGIIKSNPADLVEQEGARAGENREPFTAAEITRVLQTCATWEGPGGSDWVTMVLIGLCTGARISDCSALGTDNVVPVGSAGLAIKFKPKKNRRYKQVIEMPVVEPLLSHLRTLLKTAAPGSFFCPRVMAARNTSRVFGNILDAAGVGDGQVKVEGRRYRFRALSFHSLRHTLPTWLAAAGVPEDVRMKITGHSSKQVARGYTHAEMASIQEALQLGLARFNNKKPAAPTKGRRAVKGSKSSVKTQ